METYSIFLLKDTVVDFADVFTEKARNLLEHNTDVYEIPDFGTASNLYIFKNPPTEALWLGTLRQLVAAIPSNKHPTVSAILTVTVESRLFALTFGSAWSYIDRRKIEADFGLKSCVNGLDPSKTKSVSRVDLVETMRGAAFSPFYRDFGGFGIERLLEIYESISGNTKDGISARSLKGSTSLKWTTDSSIRQLPSILKEALNLYNSEDYKSSPFKILDDVIPIRDRVWAEELDRELVTQLASSPTNLELWFPLKNDPNSDSLGDDYSSFLYSGFRNSVKEPELLLSCYLQKLGPDKIKKLSVEALKKHQIYAFPSDEKVTEVKATVYECLTGSINYQQESYVIFQGQWYQIKKLIASNIENFFQQVAFDWSDESVPLPVTVEYEPSSSSNTKSKKSSKMESEASYNQKVADQLSYICLDGIIINTDESVRSEFEVCDLLDISGKRLIHVKKGTSSSNLSHLFRQGENSIKFLKNDPKWKEKLCKKIAKKKEFKNAEDVINELEKLDFSPDEWTVEYWILQRKKTAQKHIPFFSKVTLERCAKEILSYEAEVKLRFIGAKHV